MAWETKNKHTLNHDDLVITALAGEGRIGVVDLVRHDEEEFGQEQKQVLTGRVLVEYRCEYRFGSRCQGREKETYLYASITR